MVRRSVQHPFQYPQTIDDLCRDGWREGGISIDRFVHTHLCVDPKLVKQVELLVGEVERWRKE